MNILVLSWHPGSGNFLISGGYKRFFEIATRSNESLIIIDRFPSLYSNLKNEKIKIYEYGKNYNLNFLKKINPYIYKLFDRVFTVISISIQVMKIRNRFDLIYVPYSELPELTLPAIFFKFFLNVPVVLCNLNVNTYFLDRPLNVFLHKFADKIITISSTLKNNLEESGIFPNYINGVGFDINLNHKSKGEEKIYDAIFIGRHIEQKGILDLLKIWDLLINKYKKEYKLITVGDIPDYYQDNIKDTIHKYHLDDFICFKGKVSDQEKNNLLASSKIMVFPSKQEGWGIAPMEALSYRVPVIAYDLPVYNESIGLSDAFKKIEINDMDKFAKIVIEVLSNLDKYQRIAGKWKPILDWNKVAVKEWEIICQSK